MKAIVTVIGKDQVGITAAVCSLLAQHSINILDISQTILQEYFTMVMLVDTAACDKSIVEISQLLEQAGQERGLSIVGMIPPPLRCIQRSAEDWRAGETDSGADGQSPGAAEGGTGPARSRRSCLPGRAPNPQRDKKKRGGEQSSRSHVTTIRRGNSCSVNTKSCRPSR